MSLPGWILFWAVAVAALPMQLLGLPGTWILLADSIALRLLGGGGRMTVAALILLFSLALAGEILEVFLSVKAVRGGQAVSGSTAAALAGAFLGALAGAPFLFGAGALPGMAVGALAGVLFLNLTRGRSGSDSLAAGMAAMRGRLKGTAVKALAAAAMFATITFTVAGG